MPGTRTASPVGPETEPPAEAESRATAHRFERWPASLPGMLASGKSYSWIGTQLGCSRTTISRWSELPEVASALAEIVREASDVAKRRLCDAQGLAVDTLVDIAANAEQPASARIAAANSILDRTGVVKASEVTVSAAVTVAADGDPRAPLAAKLAALLPTLPPETDDDPDDEPAPEPEDGGSE